MLKIRGFYLLVALVLVGTLVWGGYVVASGRGDDLVQFLVDRRESAGQTQPDRGATCQYSLEGERTLVVARKAHGKTLEHRLELADTLVEPFFGGQQALIETATTADTYNCANGEFDSHTLGGSVNRVLFSSTGRSVVITLNKAGKEQALELYTYKTNPGEFEWNTNFGPLEGEIVFRRLVGESLMVAVRSANGVQIHTYNFRSSHKVKPWNEFDPEQRPFSPPGELSATRFTKRGKIVEVDLQQDGQTTTYQFDFTCKDACVWSAVVH